MLAMVEDIPLSLLRYQFIVKSESKASYVAVKIRLDQETCLMVMMYLWIWKCCPTKKLCLQRICSIYSKKVVDLKKDVVSFKKT